MLPETANFRETEFLFPSLFRGHNLLRQLDWRRLSIVPSGFFDGCNAQRSYFPAHLIFVRLKAPDLRPSYKFCNEVTGSGRLLKGVSVKQPCQGIVGLLYGNMHGVGCGRTYLYINCGSFG